MGHLGVGQIVAEDGAADVSLEGIAAFEEDSMAGRALGHGPDVAEAHPGWAIALMFGVRGEG
jgi:hypothetical protein